MIYLRIQFQSLILSILSVISLFAGSMFFSRQGLLAGYHLVIENEVQLVSKLLYFSSSFDRYSFALLYLLSGMKEYDSHTSQSLSCYNTVRIRW